MKIAEGMKRQPARQETIHECGEEQRLTDDCTGRETVFVTVNGLTAGNCAVFVVNMDSEETT